MNKIEKKKLIIIGIISLIIIVIIIKLIDTKFEKNNTKETGILNIITEEKSKETEEKIVIYITGEVINEGVYELDIGSRIANAIEAAGGTKETANLRNVNLAYELEDGEKIYIPNINETENEILDAEKVHKCIDEASNYDLIELGNRILKEKDYGNILKLKR